MLTDEFILSYQRESSRVEFVNWNQTVDAHNHAPDLSFCYTISLQRVVVHVCAIVVFEG